MRPLLGKDIILKIEIIEKPDGIHYSAVANKERFESEDVEDIGKFINYLYDYRNGTETNGYKCAKSEIGSYSA